MAVVRFPLHSFRAQGTIGGNLVFRGRIGRSVVSSRRRQRRARSQKQVDASTLFSYGMRLALLVQRNGLAYDGGTFPTEGILEVAWRNYLSTYGLRVRSIHTSSVNEREPFDEDFDRLELYTLKVRSQPTSAVSFRTFIHRILIGVRASRLSISIANWNSASDASRARWELPASHPLTRFGEYFIPQFDFNATPSFNHWHIVAQFSSVSFFGPSLSPATLPVGLRAAGRPETLPPARGTLRSRKFCAVSSSCQGSKMVGSDKELVNGGS